MIDHVKLHVADAARSRAFYEQASPRSAALAAGGSDNGAPGARERYHRGYYGAFGLDPAGNNVEAVAPRVLRIIPPPRGRRTARSRR